ncbi:MAG: NfeD family protein [Dehalococcoidales bacterium]|jgi:membrane protein implicated in regulation of membrane protease activity
MEFADIWFWLIFIIIGLVMILAELILGIETSLDLVFIGSAFILGGLVAWPFNSWPVAVIVTSVVGIAYVALGRRYVHRRLQTGKTKTNVDAIIGNHGVVLKDITSKADGFVKVGNEQWRARAKVEIKEGEEIVVAGISGVTLLVEKPKGG